MRNRVPCFLALTLLLLMVACAPTRPALVAAPVKQWRGCPMIATLSSQDELRAVLPRLHAENGGRDLLVRGLAVFGCSCSDPARVAGAGEAARIGGGGESARLGGAGERARVAGVGEGARVGGAGEAARVGGAGEGARLGGAGEGARVGGSGERARFGADGENARLGGAGEAARLGGAGEAARVGGAGEAARIGGAGTGIRCAKVRSALGYEIQAPGNVPVFVFDGSLLYRLQDGRLVPVGS